VFGIGTGLQTGYSEVQFPVTAKKYSLLRNVQTGCVGDPAFYSVGTGVVPITVKRS